MSKYLDQSLEEFGFSIRVCRILHHRPALHGACGSLPPIATVGELVTKTREQLHLYPGLGPTTLRNIEIDLGKAGLALSLKPKITAVSPVELWRLCKLLNSVINDFMPSVSKCALQRYDVLNAALIEYSRMLQRMEG